MNKQCNSESKVYWAVQKWLFRLRWLPNDKLFLLEWDLMLDFISRAELCQDIPEFTKEIANSMLEFLSKKDMDRHLWAAAFMRTRFLCLWIFTTCINEGYFGVLKNHGKVTKKTPLQKLFTSKRVIESRKREETQRLKTYKRLRKPVKTLVSDRTVSRMWETCTKEMAKKFQEQLEIAKTLEMNVVTATTIEIYAQDSTPAAKKTNSKLQSMETVKVHSNLHGLKFIADQGSWDEPYKCYPLPKCSGNVVVRDGRLFCGRYSTGANPVPCAFFREFGTLIDICVGPLHCISTVEIVVCLSPFSVLCNRRTVCLYSQSQWVYF